jgi:hypothetical protein
VAAALGRGDHENLVLDGPGPQQRLPVRLAGLGREGAGHGHEARPASGELAVELRETHVVADREAQASERRGGHHALLAGGDADRLFDHITAVIAQIDVEEVDLPVHRLDRAIGREQRAGVVYARLPRDRLGDRARQDPDAERAGERADAADDFPIDGLGVGKRSALASQVRKHLGQRDELGTALHDLADALLRRLEVGRQIVGRRHLNDAHPHQ